MPNWNTKLENDEMCGNINISLFTRRLQWLYKGKCLRCIQFNKNWDMIVKMHNNFITVDPFNSNKPTEDAVLHALLYNEGTWIESSLEDEFLRVFNLSTDNDINAIDYLVMLSVITKFGINLPTNGTVEDIKSSILKRILELKNDKEIQAVVQERFIW